MPRLPARSREPRVLRRSHLIELAGLSRWLASGRLRVVLSTRPCLLAQHNVGWEAVGGPDSAMAELLPLSDDAVPDFASAIAMREVEWLAEEMYGKTSYKETDGTTKVDAQPSSRLVSTTRGLRGSRYSLGNAPEAYKPGCPVLY